MTISRNLCGLGEEVGDYYQIVAYKGFVFVIWERISYWCSLQTITLHA
jgi:hypothetical protein